MNLVQIVVGIDVGATLSPDEYHRDTPKTPIHSKKKRRHDRGKHGEPRRQFPGSTTPLKRTGLPNRLTFRNHPASPS
ncbi:Uncharacterised protein [Mycobacteroides abscessus subsp. abscessus]|nr:Uncharacterised protein [Mycobacteroides abscessus subsp. abscessus]SKU06592.1 Uncharacterised protein [Mycobacteroides abscessus subsp. abscessus]